MLMIITCMRRLPCSLIKLHHFIPVIRSTIAGQRTFMSRPTDLLWYQKQPARSHPWSI